MKKMDMLHGSIADKTWSFALLLAMTGICQQLFNAADILIMGRFVGKSAMAAVGSNGPVVGIIVTLFIGISLGANVVISQLTGRKDRQGVTRAVHTAILSSLIGGLIMMAVGEMAASPLMALLSVPEEVRPLSLRYLRIIFLALPGILMYNFTSAIFRSQGDTRTPFLCLFISGMVKVASSLFFVLGMGMDADGAAASTVCSTLLSSFMLLALLSHTSLSVHLSLKEAVFDWSMLKKILSVGMPAGVQGAVFSLSNIVIQSAINSLGTEVMAASAAAFNLEIIAYYVINAFGQACTTFTGQNYGAGLFSRCRKIFRITFLQGFCAMAAVCGLILFLGRPLLSIFIGLYPAGLYSGRRSAGPCHRNGIRLPPGLWEIPGACYHGDHHHLRLPNSLCGHHLPVEPHLPYPHGRLPCKLAAHGPGHGSRPLLLQETLHGRG